MGDVRQKTCEACGVTFECLAGGCWCSEVDVTAAVREHLRARYQDCLCPACLREAVAASAPAGHLRSEDPEVLARRSASGA